VQGEVERALRQIGWQGESILGAGRTDAGVHATGQVIAFDMAWQHGEAALLRALNAVLPAAIAGKELAAAAADFHPRYSAASRRYRYTIYNSAIRSPLAARYAWHLPLPELSLTALNTASARLKGRRDFATFGTPPEADAGPRAGRAAVGQMNCAKEIPPRTTPAAPDRGPRGGHTVRTVSEASWKRSGEVWTFDIEADAFLFRMVRSIVGTLRLVGTGDMTPEQFVEALEAADRSRSGPPAPPNGLCLVEVKY
jgi:tRNA pseudouridine38-40 synthase